MEVVKTDQPVKRRGKTNRRKVMESRIGLAMRQVFTTPVLVKLFQELDSKDQKDLIVAFNKPAPPPRPKDEVDKLTPEQINELYNRIMSAQ